MTIFSILMLSMLMPAVSFHITPRIRHQIALSMSSRQIPKQKTATILVEDIYSDGWKLQDAIEILKKGGVGVLCTDTCYSFVTSLDSTEGRMNSGIDFFCLTTYIIIVPFVSFRN